MIRSATCHLYISTPPKPEEIGLSLDSGGWARIDELLEKANKVGIPLDASLLRQIVAENDKQRFSLSPDGQKIRANQGHSIPFDLDLEPLMPPDLLFHGTAVHRLEAIRKKGLKPQERMHVHLSPDETTAFRVGKRHGTPVILTVHAIRMYEQGHLFFRSVNRVWLTQEVPSKFLIFP